MGSDFTAKLLALVFLESLLDQKSGNLPIFINELLAPLLGRIETPLWRELPDILLPLKEGVCFAELRGLIEHGNSKLTVLILPSKNMC